MIEKKLRGYLKKNLSVKRFRHSVSTGETVRNLCRLYNLPEDTALIAGLGHDIARELKPSRIVELASSEYSVEKWELNRPKLLHGKAGAAILRQKFGVNNTDILEAVAWHTTGHPGMGDLGKIVYIADYIEPNRDHVDSVIRSTVETYSIDEAFTIIFKNKMEYLAKAGKSFVPPSKVLYDALNVKG